MYMRNQINHDGAKCSGVFPGIGKWSVLVDYKISNGPPPELRRQQVPGRAGMNTTGIN